VQSLTLTDRQERKAAAGKDLNITLQKKNPHLLCRLRSTEVSTEYGQWLAGRRCWHGTLPRPKVSCHPAAASGLVPSTLIPARLRHWGTRPRGMRLGAASGF